MIKLIDILNELNEAKQIGDIYHFTSIEALTEMVKEYNSITLDISGGSESASGYYSFTRNPNLGTLSEEKHHVRIKLDGDKMSNKYKFEPYADVKSGEDFLKGGSHFESEERINAKGKSLDLTPYIEEITMVDPKSFGEYLDMSWKNTKYYEPQLKDYEYVISWIKNNNIPLKFTEQKSASGVRRTKS